MHMQSSVAYTYSYTALFYCNVLHQSYVHDKRQCTKFKYVYMFHDVFGTKGNASMHGTLYCRILANYLKFLRILKTIQILYKVATYILPFLLIQHQLTQGNADIQKVDMSSYNEIQEIKFLNLCVCVVISVFLSDESFFMFHILLLYAHC